MESVFPVKEHLFMYKNCMTFCWIKTLKEIHLTNEPEFYAF